jgi:hypothetical protein
MARKANEKIANTPSTEDIQKAVRDIESCYSDLLKERGTYMNKCKKIRQTMSGDYDSASDKGISKKLLKKIVGERGLERKIMALTENLEDDERTEFEMLSEKLGTFANTPLGRAALASVQGMPHTQQAATG